MVNPQPVELGLRRSLVMSMRYELVPLSNVDAAIAALPPGSTVSVTCSPVRGIEATIELTDRIRALGHRAVPHLAARLIRDEAHVQAVARWLRTEAVGHAFIVGGDAERPVGPFADATTFLAALLAADPALRSVGVTGYPDGHPLIGVETLRAALIAKASILAEAAVEGYVSTQMCFDPDAVVRWIGAEREAGLALPIHLGIPGVVERKKLMSMGVRLGVGTSLRYLKKNRAAVGRLLRSGDYDPSTMLDPLDPWLEPLGIAGLHCFTFNQVSPTVEWQQEMLRRP